MLLESSAILAIIFSTFIISFKVKRKYALAMVPLLIPPVANILAYFFSQSVANAFQCKSFTAYIGINIIAVVISSVLVGVNSLKFKTKANRYSYLIMSIVFNVVLVIIYMVNY